VISSYEVGAIFRITDDATPTITRLAQEARALADAIQMARTELAALGRSAGLTTISRQLSTVTRNATAAAAALRTVGTTASGVPAIRQAAGAGGGAGGGGVVPPAGGRRYPGGGGWRRGHGAGALHISGLSTRIPGGHAYFRGSNTAMAAGGALAYGVYEEAELEDATARMMLTIPGAAEDPSTSGARRAQIRALLQDTASRTGAPIGDLEEAVLTGIRQFAGMPFDQRMQVMPGLLQAAAAEAKLKGKGTTVETAMESMTGLAHMFQVYDPAGIAKMANAFAYISAVDPEKLPQIERAASYAIPRTRMMQVDPMEELLLVGAMQRAGVRNTKAGTWISAMAQRAMPGTSLMSRVAYEKHEKELKAIGLVDDKGQPTWFEDGKPSLLKMLDIAATNLPKIPLAERGALASALFGQQGAGGIGVLADPVVQQQIHALRQEMPRFKTGLPIFEQLDKDSPVQKAREAWGDLRNVLMDIATVVLPPLTAGLKGFDDILKTISNNWPSQGRFGGIPAKGTLGDALGRGMAEGAIPGAAVGAVLGGVFGVGAGAVPGAATGAAIGGFLGGSYEGIKYLLGGATAPQRGALVSTATAAPASGTTMNVTIKVDPNEPGFLNKIAHELAELLHTSALHNQAQGQGALDSTWTAGGGISP
jgi:hypothetical protein